MVVNDLFLYLGNAYKIGGAITVVADFVRTFYPTLLPPLPDLPDSNAGLSKAQSNNEGSKIMQTVKASLKKAVVTQITQQNKTSPNLSPKKSLPQAKVT